MKERTRPHEMVIDCYSSLITITFDSIQGLDPLVQNFIF